MVAIFDAVDHPRTTGTRTRRELKLSSCSNRADRIVYTVT